MRAYQSCSALWITFILVLWLAGLAAIVADAPSVCAQSRDGENQASASQPIKQQPQPLKISSSLIKKTYCSSSNLRLTTKLALTNIGDRPLIFDKHYFAVIRTFISRDLESSRRGTHELDSSLNVLMRFTHLEDSYPAPELFVTLKPGETYVTELNDYIPLYDGNRVHDSYLKPGSYFQQSIVLTWGGPTQLGAEVKKKWEQYGLLWLEPLTTEPVQFIVDASPQIGDCGKK